MAYYSRSELCALIGKKQNYLSTYIKREKLIVNADGLIDDSNPVNREFIAERRRADRPPEVTNRKKPEVELHAQQKQKVAPAKLPDETPNDNLESLSPEQISKRLRVSKVRKTESETDFINLKKKKFEGSIIPVVMITSLIVNMTEANRIAYGDAAEDIIVRIATLAKLSREQIARLKAELKEVMNKAVDQSAEMAINTLQRLQKEYAHTREKGDHD